MPTSSDISDDDISVMVDIAKAAGTDLSADKQGRLPALLARGMVAEADNDRYKLTAAGHAVLNARGVGATEA